MLTNIISGLQSKKHHVTICKAIATHQEDSEIAENKFGARATLGLTPKIRVTLEIIWYPKLAYKPQKQVQNENREALLFSAQFLLILYA
mmetsp:Transcript_17292/g.27931  ORF Transcript_17292/g.27931 Transcript_17292/m.27931 type:complete len:89 (-) Transcript_17292:342-608(-)